MSGHTQDRLLYQLKKRGPQTVRVLADTLELTTMGVRQHLQQLEQKGLVSSLEEQVQNRGRPVKPWKLTELGHQRFPDAHAQITLDLITSIRELMGEEALNALIRRRTEETLHQYQNVIDENHLVTRIRKLVELRSAEGYMAEFKQVNEGEYLLMENHCPICVAAETCQGFCQSELEVFSALFEESATVSREEHLLHGARRCSYRIISKSR